MAEWCDASKIDWKKHYKMKKKPRGYGKKVFEERKKEWLKKECSHNKS